MSAPKKVVLAYSGGLDTSIILKWLQTEYGAKLGYQCLHNLAVVGTLERILQESFRDALGRI